MSKRTVCAALLFGATMTAEAQEPCVAAPAELVRRTPRAVLQELIDSAGAATYLIDDGAGCARTLAPLVEHDGRPYGLPPLQARLYAPALRFDVVGGMSEQRATGSAWVGRGANVFMRLAGAADVGRLHLVLAPEISHARNRAYHVFPSPDLARSSFSSPFYTEPHSIDLPSRFGQRPVTRVDPGQSAAWVRVGAVDVGASTSTQRWGPGRHGGLVLGGDSPGVPRLFARTAHPLGTRAGAWSAAVFVGTLTESPFFDRDDANNLRTLSAWTVVWSPHDSSLFHAGIVRASMRPDNMLAGPPFGSDRSEQLSSIHAQYGASGRGTRVYGELARAGPLPRPRELATIPYARVVYLVGAEHVVITRGGTLLIGAEAANLEQTTDIRGETKQDFYASQRIPQGWTQRGEVLGYPSGPGSNHAVLSLDWITSRWSAGVFADRTRWNEDAFYRQYLPVPARHDVSVRMGLRAARVLGSQELTAEVSLGRRYNYLFQNTQIIEGYRTVDIATPQLRIGLVPRVMPRR